MTSRLPLFVALCRRAGVQPSLALTALSDVLALLGSCVLAYILRACVGDFFPLAALQYAQLLPIFLLAPVLGLVMGVYRSIPQPPHEELRRLFVFVTFLYGVVLMALFLSKTSQAHSRFVVLAAWMIACLAVPLARAWVRRRFAPYPWWGLPLVILDSSKVGRQFWHFFRRHPHYGLNPAVIVDVPADPVRARKVMADTARRLPGALAMVLSPATRTDAFLSLANVYFTRILLVPTGGKGPHKFWVTPCDVGPSVGFLINQRLHDRRRLALKRVLDLSLCLAGSVLVLPLSLLLALAIRLDSRGPILYSQKRIGRCGREFAVYKFRTMAVDADEILEECLAGDPARREEWERDQKLRDDPRVTRVGRFLRRTSLDELPQLLNVLRGDMSIVGPRPIVAGEAEKYGDVFDDYKRVRPGITGLWQISGRNDTTYDERVSYDFYYINNWCVWMDIWIICRTVPVVLCRRGAY